VYPTTLLLAVQQVLSSIVEMGDRLATRHGPNRGWLLCPLGGYAGSPSNTMWPGPRSTSIPDGILIHPSVWPQQTWAANWRGPVPICGVGPHLTQYGLGRGLPLYRTKWHIGPSSRLAYPSSRLATIDMGRKSGTVPFLWGSWVPI